MIDTTRYDLKNARGNMTQDYVAAQIGISQSTLAMYESGKRNPRDKIKRKLAKLYGTTVESLFFASDIADSNIEDVAEQRCGEEKNDV